MTPPDDDEKPPGSTPSSSSRPQGGRADAVIITNIDPTDNVSTVGTVTSTSTAPDTAHQDPILSVNLNKEYLGFPPGIIRIIQLVFGLICIGCVGDPLNGYHQLFLAVACLVFIINLCMFFILVSRRDRIAMITFRVDMMFSCVAAVVYFVVSILLAMNAGGGRYIAATVFGFLNSLMLASAIIFLIIYMRLVPFVQH